MLRDLQDIFRYNELIKILVERDLKARYKNSILGYAWTWLDPLMTMFIFILVFDILLKIKVEHFPVYLLSGLIPWTFFSSSVSGSVNSITGNTGLIKRVYYPREIFPLTLALSNGINMVLSLLVLIPVILAFGLSVTSNILLLPIPILFLFFLAFGLSLVFSCLNVFFRDISYIAPFIIRLWFYLTPIFYVIEGRIPARYHDIYMMLNPLAVILSIFRASLMGYSPPAIKHIVVGFLTCIVTFFVGYSIFKKNEDLMVKRI
jgi:ABC-2 type transport system permease protein